MQFAMYLTEAPEDAGWTKLQGVRRILIGVQSPHESAAKD
jgi:hypothetical protein